MPEANNNFIKARMNKDLDDRLVPNGEYRNATNINISASEGEDVGSVQTALGNIEITDFGYSSDSRAKIIGHIGDELNNTIYVFITDFTDTSNDRLSLYAPSNATCEIQSFNFSTKTSIKLVTGNFLNFSLTHEIIGVNLLENLLFWTDNRNQPRKINVLEANPSNKATPDFYTNEDQISVAKFYPYRPIDFFNDYVTSFSITNDGGSGDPANPSAYKALFDDGEAVSLPTTGGTGSGLTVTLDTVTSDGSITALTIVDFGVGYSNGDVLTIAPKTGSATITVTVEQKSTMRDKCSEFLPPTTSATISGVSGVTITVEDTLAGGITQGWKVFSPDHPGASYGLFNAATGGTTFNIQYPADSTGAPDTPPADWVTGTVLTFSAPNPDYDANWPGDCEYLRDKFVRFSYRYKFIDGEYSLMAPFTQEAFIPREDGYFVPNAEEKAFEDTDLGWFTNKINDIDLILTSPTTSFSNLFQDMHVDSIEILYKQSDELNVKVLDTITRAQLAANTSNKYLYNYQSRAPYKVLPERDITRVSDVTPIRALAQEVSGNRVIYGNFINKHSSLDTLDYTVGIGNKLNTTDNPTQKEYQNHTVKQNRTYQVGIVLSDRYGRQSDVILSSIDDAIKIGAGLNFYGSTIFNDYKQEGFDVSDIITPSTTWPGDNLFLDFESTIPSNSSVKGYPGLYAPINPDEITNLFPGATYSLGTNIATTGGSGTGLTVDITQNNGAGNILAININTEGTGYLPGDVITVTGGDGNGTFIYNPLAQPNPTGWYTYKVVVKQQEQEYYNVYLPGILNGALNKDGTPSSVEATLSIYGDNVNKLPKDLSNIGPSQTNYNTNESLYLRVNNENNNNYSVQYYPPTEEIKTHKLTQISEMSDLGISLQKKSQTVRTAGTSITTVDLNNFDETIQPGAAIVSIIDSSGTETYSSSDNIYVKSYYADGTNSKVILSSAVTVTAGGNPDTITFGPPGVIFNANNNPEIGILSTISKIGVAESENFRSQLAVFETKPTFSNLNIFYETTTSGLISDLNSQIISDTGDKAVRTTNIVYDHKESDTLGTVVTNIFYPSTASNDTIQDVNAVGTLVSVIDGQGNDRTSDFLIETAGTGGFRIKTNSNDFVVTSNTDLYNFIFTIQISVQGDTFTETFAGEIDNVAPTWTTPITSITFDNSTYGSDWKQTVLAFNDCRNGSASAAGRYEDLTWKLKKIVINSIPSSNPWGLSASDILFPPEDRPSGKLTLNISGQGQFDFYTYPLFPQNTSAISPIGLNFEQTLSTYNNSTFSSTVQNLQAYPIPLEELGEIVAGVVDSSGTANLQYGTSPKFNGVAIGSAFVPAQYTYTFSLVDGGGLSTDYDVTVNIT